MPKNYNMIKPIKGIFLISGIYGLAVMFPMLFSEQTFGTDNPPAITHAEFFYGFIGLALVFQLLFLQIAKDPVRYKPIMIAAILEKAAFGSTVIVLKFVGTVPSSVFFFGMIDVCLFCLFLYAWIKTPGNNKS